jgi:hypothetical protein
MLVEFLDKIKKEDNPLSRMGLAIQPIVDLGLGLGLHEKGQLVFKSSTQDGVSKNTCASLKPGINRHLLQTSSQEVSNSITHCVILPKIVTRNTKKFPFLPRNTPDNF